MKRLSKNLLSLFSADIARRLLGFISVAYLARVLGKEDFGAINLGFAVLAYSMVLGASGYPLLGTKRIAQNESPELAGQVIGSRLITTIFVLIIVIITVLIFVSNVSLAWLIILFSCAILPQIFFLDWFFQGKEAMGIVSAARVLQALVYLIVILFFVHSSNDVLLVAVGAIIGECAAAILLFYRFRSLNAGVRIHIEPSFQLLKQSLPLAVGIILAAFVINYPIVALGIFSDTASVGIFSAAVKLVYFLMMGDRILFLLLIPASARQQANSPEKFKEMLFDATYWILLLGLPMTVGGILIADDVINLIFGSEYFASTAVFQVLVWYFFLTMLHTVFTAGLIGAGGEKAYGKIMMVTTIAYFICVSSGALWFGALGAAFGVVIAEGISVVLISRALKYFVLLKAPKKLFHIVISVILMSLVVVFLLNYGLLLALCVGIVSYCVFIFSFRAVTRDDIKTLIARF